MSSLEGSDPAVQLGTPTRAAAATAEDAGRSSSDIETSRAAGVTDPYRWRALAVLLIVQFMLLLDVSVVNVALPTLDRDLNFGAGDLTWVVDAYVLIAGGLLLLGGRLGDAFGRRRVFVAGAALFGLASLACAAAPNSAVLVTARFFQGAGEALAAPAALGIIAVMFTDTRERAKAIGFFGGITGLGGTSGPIIGGALIEASWRWIFLINVPVVLVALILATKVISPRYDVRDPSCSRRLDIPGAVLVTGGCLAIVYGAVEAATQGWSSATVIVFMASGAALLVAFVITQRSVAEPLMPPHFFHDRTRAGANAVSIVFYSVFFTQFFLVTLFLQNVRGYSALQTGLSFLPFGMTLGVAIGIATGLLPRIGTRSVLAAGVIVSGIAMLLFTRITPDGTFVHQMLPASLAIAFGSGLCLPSLTTAAVHAVTDRDAGLAAGLQQALQQIGGAIGLAALITIAVRSTATYISNGVTPLTATTDGFILAFRIAAAVLLVALILTISLITPRRDR